MADRYGPFFNRNHPLAKNLVFCAPVFWGSSFGQLLELVRNRHATHNLTVVDKQYILPGPPGFPGTIFRCGDGATELNAKIYDFGPLPALNAQVNLTLSVWIRSLDVYGMLLVGVQDASSSFEGVQIEIWDGLVYYGVSPDNAYVEGHIAFPTDNKWHNYVLAFNGGGFSDSDKLKGFIDGKEQTLTYNQTPPTITGIYTDSFQIHASYSNPMTTNAEVCDIRVWNRTLTLAEIFSLYNPSTRWSLYAKTNLFAKTPVVESLLSPAIFRANWHRKRDIPVNQLRI